MSTPHKALLQPSGSVNGNCLAQLQGKLLAGINSRVQLFKWNQKDDGSWELTTETGHSGHVLALYLATRGDFIIVGTAQLLPFLPLETLSQPVSVSCCDPTYK